MDHGALFIAGTLIVSACGTSGASTSGPGPQEMAAACSSANTTKTAILEAKNADVAAGKLTSQSAPCALTPAEKTALGPGRTAQYADACAQYERQSGTCTGTKVPSGPHATPVDGG